MKVVEFTFRRMSRVLAACALSCSLVVPAFAQKSPVADRHKEFLNGPTSLLITRAERSTFDALQTDDARDKFVENFWEVRNPKRGTGTNEFKEEFYKRLAFASNFYGKDAGSEGWRTDRGRTYILFGQPKSTQSFIHNQELVASELWFYSNPGLRELPAFFYILFFDRNGSGEYRYYHPYVHGPDKLIRSEPTKAQAYQYLRRINNELAQASLTLIPGEPVDTESFNGSISSATILNAAQAYNQMRSYESLIASRWNTFETVKSKITYKLTRAGLVTFAATENGEPWLHWRLEMNDEAGPQDVAGSLKYEISAKLMAGGKLVYERSDAPELKVPASAAAQLRSVAYENRMPVAPGKYTLQVTAKWPSGQVFETQKDLVVPVPTDRAAVSEVLVSEKPEPDSRLRAFQFRGYRFSPSVDPAALSSRGVSVLYQVTIPAPRPEELEVEYVVADSTLKARKTLSEKLATAQADAFGTLMVAKTLPIEEFAPGTYQLAVRIKDPKTGRISGNNTRFTVVADRDDVRPIVIAPVTAESQQRVAANHYERALAWLAQGDPEQAKKALQTSWEISRNPAVQGLLVQLSSSGNSRQSIPGRSREGKQKEQE